MIKAVELVKKHPYVTGAAVIGAIIFIVIVSSGGSDNAQSAYPSGPTDSEIAAGVQLQQLQAAASANNAQTAAEREVALANIAGNLEIAKLQFGFQSEADKRAQEIANKQLETQLRMNQQDNRLQQALAQKNLISTRIQTRASLLAQKQDALTIRQQARLNTRMTLASIRSAIRITKINDDDSWWDSIFG